MQLQFNWWQRYRNLAIANRFFRLHGYGGRTSKAIDLILTNCSNTYSYLDDILIVTKGSIDIEKQKLQTILAKLDGEIFAISLDKCRFVCREVEWLRYSINSEGTTSLIRKTEAIEKLSPPNIKTS